MISFISVAFVERAQAPKAQHERGERSRRGRAAGAAATKAEERRAIGVASGAHALHDGYTDLIYVMLPLWQAEFGIGYAALGLLRTCYSGTMAGLQIPSALLSERLGVPLVLAVGTALSGIGYLIAGASVGFLDAGDRAPDRRARLQHAASAGVGAGRPRLCRAALA